MGWKQFLSILLTTVSLMLVSWSETLGLVSFVQMVYFCCICGARRDKGTPSCNIYPPEPCAEDNMTGFVTGYRLGKSFDLVTPIAVNPPPAKFAQKGLQICPKHFKDNNPTTDEYRMVHLSFSHWCFHAHCSWMGLKALAERQASENATSSAPEVRVTRNATDLQRYCDFNLVLPLSVYR